MPSPPARPVAITSRGVDTQAIAVCTTGWRQPVRRHSSVSSAGCVTPDAFFIVRASWPASESEPVSALWACARWCSPKTLSMPALRPIRSSAWLTARLASARPNGGSAAIRSAIASVSSSSCARSITRVTIPSSYARCAGIRSARNSIALAARGPTAHGCAKYSTPGMPIRSTGSMKNASSAATIRSQAQASISPPAMQAPWTIAIVGLGSSRQRLHMPR